MVGVRTSLQIPGVSFILGNDLAGRKVWSNTDVVSPPIVMSVPKISKKPDYCARRYPDVFPACAVTRAMAKQSVDSDLVPLENTFLVTPEVADNSSQPLPVGQLETTSVNSVSPAQGDNSDVETESVELVPPVDIADETMSAISGSELDVCSLSDLFKVSREELIKEQSVDPSLEPMLALASSRGQPDDSSGYLLQDGFLCRRWIFKQEMFSNTAGCCSL